MKNGWKRALAVLMTLTMVLALFPVNAWALEPEEDEPVVSEVEQIEAQSLDESEDEVAVYADETQDDVIVYATEEEAVAAIREQLKQRATSITVRLRTIDSGPMERMLYAAWAHDENDPTGGDYIHYQVGKKQFAAKPDYNNGTTDFYYTLAYYDTLEQEKELDTRIAEVLQSLNLNGKSDYEKIKAIYDYICANVTYDNKHLNDAKYTLKYTAYAALINGTAVCQGYANLFYRMALSVGVDCRVITGLAGNTGHGWNIVKLNGKYYNVDTTWDAGIAPEYYMNFLKAEGGDFSDTHYRDKDFNSGEFWEEYPMALNDYFPVTAMSIDVDAIELEVEDTRLLSATVEPDWATEPDVTWASSEPTIVTVDNSGKITAVGYGTATITASAGGKAATCTVTVKHTHSLKAYAEKKATCIETGNIAYWECTLCGALFSNAECTVITTETELKIDVDPNNHVGSMEQRDAKAPTCTEEGHEADTYCRACNTLVRHGDTIKKAPHDLTKNDAELGTCATAGSIAYWECKVCGELFSDAQGNVKTDLDAVKTDKDTTNHTGGQAVRNARPATCADEGYTGDTYCLGCKTKIAGGTAIPKTAHALEIHKAQQATCVDEGNDAYWTCTACGGLFSNEQGTVPTTQEAVKKDKNPENHVSGTEVKNEKPATCMTPGYTGDVVCKDCGKVLNSGIETAKAAHQLTHYEAKAATCKETGSIEYWQCTTCNGLFSDGNGTTPVKKDALSTPVDQNNHSGATKIVGKRDATCTETGYTGDVVCTGCNQVVTKGTTIAKIAHQLVHVDAKAATCKEDGNIEYWKCESCSKMFSDSDGKNTVQAVVPINKNNHVGGTELRDVKGSTCTDEGYTGDSYCLSCGVKISAGTAVPKAAHELTKHEAVAATHSVAGSIAYWSCKACNGLFSDAAGKQPITAQETVIPATEQKADTEYWAFDGTQHWNVCTDCGEQLNAAAHTFGDWTTQKEATTTTTGVKVRTCTTCDFREQAEIPVLTTAETVKPSTSQKPERQTKTENQKSPRTADNSLSIIGMTALTLAASGVLVTALVRKKRMK